MGCDIHCYVERWFKDRWVPVDAPNDVPEDIVAGTEYKDERWWKAWGRWTPPRPHIAVLAEAFVDPKDLVPDEAQEWAFGRNYDAFSLLADVRNDNLVPFAQPRDLPSDVSEAVMIAYCVQVYPDGAKGMRDGTEEKTAKKWCTGPGYTCSRHVIRGQRYVTGPDWHSASYYTLKELSKHVRSRKKGEIPARILDLQDELRKVAKTYRLTQEKVRNCFWFDN